jgi:hypothetical protein
MSLTTNIESTLAINILRVVSGDVTALSESIALRILLQTSVSDSKTLGVLGNPNDCRMRTAIESVDDRKRSSLWLWKYVLESVGVQTPD